VVNRTRDYKKTDETRNGEFTFLILKSVYGT